MVELTVGSLKGTSSGSGGAGKMSMYGSVIACERGEGGRAKVRRNKRNVGSSSGAMDDALLLETRHSAASISPRSLLT